MLASLFHDECDILVSCSKCDIPVCVGVPHTELYILELLILPVNLTKKKKALYKVTVGMRGSADLNCL